MYTLEVQASILGKIEINILYSGWFHIHIILSVNETLVLSEVVFSETKFNQKKTPPSSWWNFYILFTQEIKKIIIDFPFFIKDPFTHIIT